MSDRHEPEDCGLTPERILGASPASSPGPLPIDWHSALWLESYLTGRFHLSISSQYPCSGL
jgi:hypothetical protein